jgi:hypothetical protein
MSTPWTALLPAATVGTDRHSAPLPRWPGDIGEAIRLAAEAAPDPATALLRAAAVLAGCSLAGAQGAAWHAELPAPAADDILPALGPGPVLEALTQTCFDGPQRLQHEACLILERAGLRLPETLLPQALELGRRSIALRAPLLPVLGQRGLWLAAQRDDWAYAAGATEADDNEAHWTDGTLEQRHAWLTRLRAADPAAGRARLQTALPELPARERAELAAALAAGLNLADEALLETLRADRARDVRQVALQLLLRLPDGAHPRRAIARLAPLVVLERGLLRKRWQVEAPQAAAEDWKADQIDATRPKNESLGERAWWLYQLVRQVPLAWWPTHTGMGAAELIAWATGTDWAEALLRGWRDVLFATPDADWCDALLDRWPAPLRENPAQVLALLPPARRERHLLRRLRDGGDTLAATLAQILAACPAGESLSAEASRLIVEQVQAAARQGLLNTDYGLRGQLAELACALAPERLAALTDLTRRADETPSCAEALALVERTVAVRRALHTLIPPRTP